MLHPKVLTISYERSYEIKQRFKEVLGLFQIKHFSLDLVRPDGQMLFFSGTPSHGYEVCSKGFGAYDPTIAPENYKNKEFYWWHELEGVRYVNEIEYIRQIRHGFKYGFMLVRRWDDFYLVYSFAAGKVSKNFIERIENSINELFEAGDYVYNSMRDIYAEYTGVYVPPLIDKFYPYVGGPPVARYSNVTSTPSGIFVSKKNSTPYSPLRLMVDNQS